MSRAVCPLRRVFVPLCLATAAVFCGTASAQHTADQNSDFSISLSELLRVIQFFNSAGFHCDEAGEDGYAPGGGDTACAPHDSDYSPQDWEVSLSELLRLIQFFNIGEYHCDALGEDGYATGNGSRDCGSAEGEGEGSANPEINIVVDPLLIPDYPTMPPLEEFGPDRPVAAIEDEFGNKANFIANELVVSTDDTDALDAFLARWGGTVLMTLDPARGGLPIDPQYLVQINTTLANTADLIDDLHMIVPDQDGDHTVSSMQGMELLSAAASEVVDGLGVGVNWIGLGNDIDGRFTPEGPSGPTGYNSLAGTYTNNSFNWNFLDAGSTQDIGVTEAWWLLEQVDRLKNKVKVGILDGGFFNTDDLPASYVAISNIPFLSAMGTANPGGCSGGDCSAHGTNVAGAAFGVVGNNFGAAGPAGPVASPVLVLTYYDYFTSMFAVGEALFLGARIINMSYSAEVPAIVSWTVLPFEAVTAGAAATGNLLFASAGNSGKNVDAERCFIACWERAWHTPCENAGVVCVGGLERDSQNKADGSNYGPEQVDIYAPYRVLVGPDNGSSGSNAQAISGTSFSSPHTAGIAALIWAANPSLNAGQVLNILYDTAHTSPDSDVNRYVNAYDAVQEALGSVIHIQSPNDGVSVDGGANVNFTAFVAEGGRGTPAVSWTSNRDGEIGTGLVINVNDLSFGAHTITARALFPDSFLATDTISVNVDNDPPVVTITAPDNIDEFYQGQSIGLTGTSFDPNNAPGYDLSDAQVSWYVDDNLLGTGHAQTITAGTLSLGAHTIRFDGTDGSLTDSDSISITILENPVDLPPDSVNITAPENNYSEYADEFDGQWYKEVTLMGNASDPEDGTLTGDSLTWTTRINGGAAEVLGTGTSLTARLYTSGCGVTHEITLTAKDSATNESSASITVTIPLLCK